MTEQPLITCIYGFSFSVSCGSSATVLYKQFKIDVTEHTHLKTSGFFLSSKHIIQLKC